MSKKIKVIYSNIQPNTKEAGIWVNTDDGNIKIEKDGKWIDDGGNGNEKGTNAILNVAVVVGKQDSTTSFGDVNIDLNSLKIISSYKMPSAPILKKTNDTNYELVLNDLPYVGSEISCTVVQSANIYDPILIKGDTEINGNRVSAFSGTTVQYSTDENFDYFTWIKYDPISDTENDYKMTIVFNYLDGVVPN